MRQAPAGARQRRAGGGRSPLAGVRVIDLTRYVAGPFCTQLLGDYGAEVIKVEPLVGARQDPGSAPGRDGYFFFSVNRSKKSLQLDYRQPAGRAALLKLVRGADVVIDNFRPRVMERLGLGYRVLSRLNPRIITCNVSGFGASGPLRDAPGFDQVVQGFSGLMSVTGTPQSGPMRMGVAICDLLAGMFAAYGIVMALLARRHTGRGQRVETSLLEAAVGILSWSAGSFFETGKSPKPQGNHHPLVSPYGLFMAADRPLNIAVGSERMWQSFVRVIGRPELAADPRFESERLRVENRAALTAEIERALAGRRAVQWVRLFAKHGIPAGPVLNLKELFVHPQVAARRMLLKLTHPQRGEVFATGLPVKLSASRGRPRRPPLLGEHTGAVLEAAGFSRAELARLRSQGVIP